MKLYVVLYLKYSKSLFSLKGIIGSDNLRKEIEKEIEFVNIDTHSDDFYIVFKTQRFKNQKYFRVRKIWRNNMQKLYQKFDLQLTKIAEDIYIERTYKQCEKEKEKGLSKPSCVELKELRI